MSGTGRRRYFNPLIAGFIAGVAIATVIGLMAKINVDFAAPWTQTHTVAAEVSDVDGISIGSDVRVAGRLIGQITDVKAKGDHSEVTFHVDNNEWPLPADTSASVRLATLLGQKYLQLTPGSDTSHRLQDNATIGLPATKPVVDFDQILDTFDKPTRDSLTSLLRTASSAVQGQEGTLQQLIPNLRDLSVHSVTPTTELVTRNAEINNILINLGTTSDQLNQSRNDLAGVIDNMNTITGALAHNQAALEGYIANVDAINRTTDAVLGNGGAENLNAGLQRFSTITHYLDTLMNQLIPESSLFKDSGAYIDARNLVFEITSATSQSDKSGYFLRQRTAGIDPCGLLPCSAPPPSPPSPPTLSPPTLVLPTLPGIHVPTVQVPPLPIPALPTAPLPGLGINGGNHPIPSPSPLIPGIPPIGIRPASTTSFDRQYVDYLLDWGYW